jgi:hypothetical protein
MVAAFAVVVGLLGWGVTGLLTDDDTPSPAAGHGGAQGSPRSSSEPSDTGDGPTVETAQVRLDRCVAELHRVEQAVRAARSGVTSWKTHVQARTDMLAGRLSEKRMEAIYERTKRQGHADQASFARAVASLTRARPCQRLRHLPKGVIHGRVTDCVVRSRAAAAALAAARSTMEEWQAHLRHMATYADGGMRRGKALALWVAAWRKAPAGITAYHKRAADLAAAPHCSAS